MKISKEEIICEHCGMPILYPNKPCPNCNTINMKNSKLSFNLIIKEHKKSLIASLLSILIVVFSLFFWIPKTPEYSIYMMMNAVKNQDLETFEEYVNIDSVANNYVNDVFDYAKPKGNSWVDDFASGFMELMKPQLITYISTQLKTFVDNPVKYNVKPEDINLPKISGILIVKHFDNTDISIKNQGSNVKLFTVKNKTNSINFGLKLIKSNTKHRYIVVAIDSTELFNKLKQ